MYFDQKFNCKIFKFWKLRQSPYTMYLINWGSCRDVIHDSVTWKGWYTGLYPGYDTIRNNCSALHNDLFHANLIHSPSCSCGYSTENVEHFLLYCKRFDAQRNILYRSLLVANVHIDLNTLLFGRQIYNIDTNRHVFITVQTYIKGALTAIIVIFCYP